MNEYAYDGYGYGAKIPKNNVELSFNGGHHEMDFIVGYRRKKPLNKFQIWMFNICFGICARNV